MTPFTFSLAAVTGVMMADLMPFQMEDTVFFRPLKRLPTVVFTPVTTPTTPDLMPFHTVEVTDWMPCQMLLTVFFTALMPLEMPLRIPFTIPNSAFLMAFHTDNAVALMLFHRPASVAWKDCQAYHVLSKKPRMPSRALRVTVWMVSKTP